MFIYNFAIGCIEVPHIVRYLLPQSTYQSFYNSSLHRFIHLLILISGTGGELTSTPLGSGNLIKH